MARKSSHEIKQRKALNRIADQLERIADVMEPGESASLDTENEE